MNLGAYRRHVEIIFSQVLHRRCVGRGPEQIGLSRSGTTAPIDHAARKPVYGLAMIEELGRHGYKVSAGTLYLILHGLEERGYLTSTEERSGSVARRVYSATEAGRATLATAKSKVRELFEDKTQGGPGR